MIGAAALALAAIAIVAIGTMVGAAEAGFRYVPAAGAGEAGAQTDAVASVERTDAGHADPPPGSGPAVSGARVSDQMVSGTSVSGTSVWRIRAGETLRAALSRWAATAGADVTFLTDRRYRLDGAAAFEGAFPLAVEALFQGLGHLPHPPAGAVSADGRSLAVTHRARRAAERARRAAERGDAE